MQREIKTALVLGGGGARGAYEIGVWQALREMDLPIDIITGTSVGAINGAMIAQDSFDLTMDLWKRLETKMVFDRSILKKGDAPLKTLLKNYIDEASIRKSPIDYGLVTVELPSLAPRYLFREHIPEGKLIDYVIASSSIFPALLPHDIDNIKYVDGGYQDNLPIEMAIQRGADQIIAVDLDAGIIRHAPPTGLKSFTRIRSQWDLGNILIFKGANASRIMRLGYLDTLKAFSFYDGSYYCFPKGQFSKKTLESAELAGKLFGLDPSSLYSREIFHRRLRESVSAYRKEIQRELQEFNIGIRNKKIGRQGIPNLLQKVNERTLTIVIADFLQEHPLSEKTFLTKSALTLFREPFKAAGYLIREGLI